MGTSEPTTNPTSYRPLIGVMVSQKNMFRFLRQKPFPRFAELAYAAQDATATLYFFAFSDVNLDMGKITGVYYNKYDKKWVRMTFPFPDVLYRRSVSLEKQKFQAFRKRLEQNGIRYLNYPNAFNKWDVYQQLSKQENIRSYLPQTKTCKQADELKAMIKQWGTIYVKAQLGGRGKQVMRISKSGKGGYVYRYFRRKLVIGRVKSFRELWKKVRVFFGKKPLIVQQAIELMRLQNKLFDLRAEVQRNEAGKLDILGISVRYARKGSPITTHAQSYPIDIFFSRFLGEDKKAVEKQVQKATTFVHTIYRAVERAYGPVGELGIDFGMDTKGRLWFIECNSRTKKVSLYKAFNKEVQQRSCLNLVHYAIYLHQSKKGSGGG